MEGLSDPDNQPPGGSDSSVHKAREMPVVRNGEVVRRMMNVFKFL